MSNSIHRPHENNLLKVSVLLGDIVILNLLYWLFCSFIPLEYFVQIMRTQWWLAASYTSLAP